MEQLLSKSMIDKIEAILENGGKNIDMILANSGDLKKNIEPVNNNKNDRQSIINERVKFWSEFSTHPQTEEDIRYYLINDPDAICICYICEFSKLSESFIKEMAVLSTGYFEKGEIPSIEVLETVGDVILNKYNDRCKLIEEIYDYHFKNIGQDIDDKYKCIPKQIIAKMKKDRYKGRTKIDWKAIYKNQKLSKEFKRRYLCLVRESNASVENITRDPDNSTHTQGY